MSVVLRIVAVGVLFTGSVVEAADKLTILPTQVGEERARYYAGDPIVQLSRPEGVVEVTPEPFLDHGSLAFTVAVMNTGERFGVINAPDITGIAGKQPLVIFTADQLRHKADSRAAWSKVGLAMVGGLAAVAAASSRDTYRSTLVTPRGTYHYTYSEPSAAGQMAGAAYAAGTVYGISRIQQQLDQTRAAIGANAFQLTTIDAGDSYAARVVLTKIKNRQNPQRVDLTVRWQGIDYPFAFMVGKSGMPVPPMKMLELPPPKPMQVTFDPPSSVSAHEPMIVPGPVSVADEVAKLAALRDRGVLTETEFQDQKAATLRR